MFNRFVLTTVVCFLGIITLQAQQSWQEMREDPNANFFDIQAAAEAHYQAIPMNERKGTGWKQYKRWEAYQEQRVDEKGNFPKPGIVLQEMEKYYQTHNNPRNYTAGSGTWEAVGPFVVPENGTSQPTGNGRLTCLAFHPTDPNILYAGAPAGGFWKSTDKGITWAQYVTGMVRLGVSSIVVHPTNPNIIYIGTGDRDSYDAPGYGVWRSLDGGLTWAAHNSGMGNRTVNEILMHPSNPDIMVAATTSSRIYRTIDGGTTWTSTTLGATARDIAFKPGDPNTVYAAGTRFYKSTDGGQNFTQVTTGLAASYERIAIAVSPLQPDLVYLLAGGATGMGTFEGVFASTNSGASFTVRSTTPNLLGYSSTGSDDRDQASYDLVLAADPTNANVLYAGGINVWKSIDGGVTWTINAHWVGSGGAAAVHADQHVMEFSPHNSSDFYLGNDGGLYHTNDGGLIWADISDGLGIAQLYKMGVAQTNDKLVINGYQDNGTAIYREGNFATEIGGDGMECIIDPLDDTYMYGALYYGDIRRSSNGGTSFSGIAGSVSESGAWVTPYKLDPNNTSRMYAGFDNVWRTDSVKNSTVNWTQISSFTGTSNMTDLAIAPSNSDVIYASRSRTGERFFKTTNATAASPTWVNLTTSLPSSSTPKDIEIDPTNADHLFIAVSNNIYESTDGGSTWADITGALPNISLNTIVIDKDSPVEAMYVGMDVGVYYKDNTLIYWEMYATGLPNVEITELEIHQNASNCTSKLYAATYGQGLQVSDLKDPGGLNPIACFEASATSGCVGSIITLMDNTSFTPVGWSWTISPASYVFVAGTNANSQHPKVQFNAAGNYTISLTANNAIGFDLETKISYITINPSNLATSFNDDLEAYATCSTLGNCGATICDLVGSQWVNITEDDVDWRIDINGTGTSNTGPSMDFNPGTTAGKYAYLEASGSCGNREGILEAKCVDLDQNYDLQFAYHMYGVNTGSLTVGVNDGAGWVYTLFSATGEIGNMWNTANIDLSGYTGQTVDLRIVGTIGNGIRSDIAIDDIKFALQTVLSTQVSQPQATCANGKNYTTISWLAQNQQELEQFQIQKQLKNGDWQVLGELAATSETQYNYIDKQPLSGTNTYRILSIDANGITQASKVIKTDCTLMNKGLLEVYPNPFQNDFTLSFTANFATAMPYQISNLLGQQIIEGQLTVQEGQNTISIPTKALPVGVYLLHLDNKTVKLVKN